MNVTFSKDASKALSRLDGPTKQRIRQGICGIPNGDVKPLQGYSDRRMRLRIGKYRIVFKVLEEDNRKALYIMDVGLRGDIYK